MIVERIKISDIKHVENSRASVDKNLASLMSSIQQNGLQQPIGVNLKDKKYEIMYGNRRLHACMKLGWTTINAVIYTDQKDNDLLIHNLVENVQRENVSPSEIGRVCENLMEKGGLNKEEISVRIGLPVSTIEACLRVYKDFPDDLRKKVVFQRPGTRKQSGMLSVTAVAKVLSTRKRFGLSAKGVRNLMEHAAIEDLSAEDIQIIASLMQTGMSFDKALIQRKQYRVYIVSVCALKDEVEELSKKSSISPISYITGVIYGENTPLAKPSFINIGKGTRSVKT